MIGYPESVGLASELVGLANLSVSELAGLHNCTLLAVTDHEYHEVSLG